MKVKVKVLMIISLFECYMEMQHYFFITPNIVFSKQINLQFQLFSSALQGIQLSKTKFLFQMQLSSQSKLFNCFLCVASHRYPEFHSQLKYCFSYDKGFYKLLKSQIIFHYNSIHLSKMLKSDQSDSFYTNDCDNISELNSQSQQKYHSILPDLATGWRPKNAKIAAPIFVTYQDNLVEHAMKVGLSCLIKLVYIGPRHDNSYKFHSLTQHSYNVKYGIKCDQVPFKLKKELEQFTIKSNSRKCLFSGMNPNLQKQLQFESNFESGNLDLVTKISATQYNLFLRPDTNTRGHMQWFYFKVSNTNYSFSKVKFNICNNRKAGVLYCRGMKPYVYSKYAENNRGIKWHQNGQNIEYKRLIEKQSSFLEQMKIYQLQNEVLSKYYCLSFQYTFESQEDQVYFAYCPPFTYSQMKNHLQQLKKKSNPHYGVSVTQQNLGTSLTGLQIPIITIKDQSVDDADKKCIVATGRFHPGQSNGSHVLKGFMDYLVSPEAEYLRKKIIFKIIPMVNPDGVVFGNYRTSLSGKDLNRKFKAKNIQLFPETTSLKNFVVKLKREQKMKILYFLDFHGHSIKKNVFLYGPQYDIWSTKFERAKILPKMIASKTTMFRYQSCLFRVAATKKTTARAFMLGLIPYCYTIESSVGIYRSFTEKQKVNFYFDILKFQEMGKVIGQSLKDTILKLDKEGNQTKKKKKSTRVDQQEPCRIKISKQSSVCGVIKQNLPFSSQYSKDSQKVIQTQKIKKQSFLSEIDSKQNIGKQKQEIESQQTLNSYCSQMRLSSSKSSRPKKNKENPIKIAHNFGNTLKNFRSAILQSGFPQIKEEEVEESDGYSEGKSDCESDDNDFDRQEYKKISGRIIKFIQNFNISVVGERNKNFRMRNKKKGLSTNKSKNIASMAIRRISNQEMTMVPSLKHKILKRQFSQKRITVAEQKQESVLKSKKMSIYKFEQKMNKGNI